MIEPDFVIVDERNSFAVGYSTQRQWSLLIAAAFFLGELGAGVFFVSALYNYYAGALIGFLIATVGKGIPHLIYLGRPERFLRAFLRPRKSWISRGFISMAVFGIFGVLYLSPFLIGLINTGTYIIPGDSGAIWLFFKIIALLACFILITYDGLLMSTVRAIPFWNTPLLPILTLSYSFLGGTTLIYLFYQYSLGNFSVLNIEFIHTLEMFLIVFNLILLIIYIYAMSHSTIAARESVNLLTKGKYRWPFVGLILIVGLVIVFGLSLYLRESGLASLIYIIVAAELIGDFTLVFILLRAGVFYPEIY